MKNTVAMGLLSVSMASFALPAPQTPFDGLMGSVSLGGMLESSLTTTSLYAPQPTTPAFRGGWGAPAINYETTSNTNNIGNNGPIGEMALTYGKNWQRYYLGADVFANLASYQITDRVTKSVSFNTAVRSLVQTNTINMNSAQYGVDLLPGFIASPSVLVYGRIGLAETSMTLNTSFVDAAEQTAETNPTKSNNLTGLRLGLGVAHTLASHWNLNLDYIFTNFCSVTNSATFHTTNPASTQITYTNTLRSRVYTNALMVGVSHQF